jgi:hypothetical protein
VLWIEVTSLDLAVEPRFLAVLLGLIVLLALLEQPVRRVVMRYALVRLEPIQ